MRCAPPLPPALTPYGRRHNAGPKGIRDLLGAQDLALQEAARARADALYTAASQHDAVLARAQASYDETLQAAQAQAKAQDAQTYGDDADRSRRVTRRHPGAAEHLQGASLERATRREASAGEHAEAIRLATINRSSALRQAAAVFDQAVEQTTSARAEALRGVSAEQDEALRRARSTYDRSLLPGAALGSFAMPAASTGTEDESVEGDPPDQPSPHR